jgi:cell wall-associated NlpC family hydrolase/peptidoglycan hydrolase CwlO-like protein
VPRRVNLTILLSLIIVLILLFGLSAGARPDEEGQSAEPGDDSAGAGSEDDAVKDARNELERLQWEVQAVHGARLNALGQKEQAADDIAGTQNELAAAEQHRAETERQLADTASDAYKHPALGDLLGVLLGTETPGGFVERLDLATRMLTQKQEAVEDARGAEDKLAKELEERRNKLQEWESTDAEQQALEEQAHQAEAGVQNYLDSLDEGVREKIEADRARQAELDQARGQEILQKLEEEDESSADTPTRNLAAPQTVGGQLDELRSVEHQTEENVVEKVAQAEQARLTAEQAEPNLENDSKVAEPQAGQYQAGQAERAGLDAGPAVTEAEQAATEAARQAQAAEQARRLAEQDAATNRAQPQAAAKKTQLPLQVSDDKDGVANEGDQLRVEGDYKITPGASVTVEDADGTRGTVIDGVDANIAEGSIDITLMGTPNNVTGGDGVLETTGTLGLVDTTGIDTGLGVAPLAQEDTTGAAGLQVDPLIGAVGGQPNLLTGVVGGKTDPLTGVVGGQTDPLAKVAGSQPKPGAVSGQPGLQPASSAPVTGSPSGKGIVSEAMSWLGTPYSYGGTSRGGISCSGLVMMAYGKFGISLPNSPEGQLGLVGPLKSGSAPPGAIVFFAEHGGGSPTHVGISNGDGTMTDANVVKGMVGITPIDIVPGYMGWGFPPGI